MSIRLTTWNVAGRVGNALDRQAAALEERQADLIALQEVTSKTVDRWIERLRKSHPYARDSRDRGDRRYFNLTLSRWPLRELKGPEVPRPERLISCSVKSPTGIVHLHNVHVPDGSNEWKKIETFEAIHAHLARPARVPRILCGDFNSPQSESVEGEVTPFGDGRPARWGEGELSVITGLAEHGLPDVFRALNGYAPRDYSWRPRQGKAPIGRRLDHIFASPSLNAVECFYHHDWREDGLSDHSGMEATFEPR